MNAPGLWSLWDMIKQDAGKLLKLGAQIESSRHLLAWASEYDVPEDMKQLSVEEKDTIRQNLIRVWDLCEEVDLPVAHNVISAAVSEADGGDNLPRTRREFDRLLDVVRHELKTKLFLFVETHRAKYYESERLTDATTKAFPTAAIELRMSGNAYASSLDTACVIHAMRAAEIGLKALATVLNATLPKPIELMDWQDLLNALNTPIKNIANGPRTKQRDEDMEFYSEAAAQLTHFKHAWRNRGAHGAVFSEQQGRDVMEHVCQFFETLAKRLKE
jgi:hypothetical protein